MSKDSVTRSARPGKPKGARSPRSVYGVGDEPDPRFSFANERTFLAWIRTSLALMAAGVALEALEVPDAQGWRTAIVIIFAVLGCVSSATAYVRWARAERALRQSQPLPSPHLAPLIAFGLVIAAVVVVVLLLVD